MLSHWPVFVWKYTEGSCMRRKSPVSPSCQPVRKHPARGSGELWARPQRSAPVGAELTRSYSIIHHGLPPGSGAYPAGPGGAAAPATGSEPPSSPRQRALRAPPLAPGAPRPRSSASPAPSGGPAHLDPLHGGLQLQLLHQALHGAQAAGRRHDGAGRNGTARIGTARLGTARLGSAGTAGAARGRDRRRPAPRSDPRVMISIFHPRVRLFSSEMPLYRSLLSKNR